jgi:hypothetical protein
MDWIGLVVAMLLPWLLGIAWLRYRWERASSGSWAVLLGYGYILGMLATTLVMRLQDAVGLQQSFGLTAAFLSGLTALGVWLNRDVSWKGWGNEPPAQPSSAGELWKDLVFGLLLGLIIIRLAGLGLEILWRPLYPWDSFMNWAPKARVSYELKTLAPFVDPTEWLKQDAQGAYTVYNHHYPPTIPLIQLWMALSLGRWDDALINLPWLQCAVALGLGFYGQARAWGAQPLTAVVFTYLLLSMPLLETHVALAGYADLWMAAIYALASMSFVLWLRDRDTRQGAIALLLALGCALIKQPGIAWMLTFLPALLVAILPGRWAAGLAAVTGLAIVALPMSGGFQADIPRLGTLKDSLSEIVIPHLANYQLRFYPVWISFFEAHFVQANWHLFWYMWFAVMLSALPKISSIPFVRAVIAQVIAAFSFIILVFFFTDKASDAIDYITINRAVLHMVPMLLFYSLILFSIRISL